jgi:hypothetical protein
VGEANKTTPSAAAASVPEKGRPSGELSIRSVPVVRSMIRSAVTGEELRDPPGDSAMYSRCPSVCHDWLPAVLCCQRTRPVALL